MKRKLFVQIQLYTQFDKSCFHELQITTSIYEFVRLCVRFVSWISHNFRKCLCCMSFIFNQLALFHFFDIQRLLKIMFPKLLIIFLLAKFYFSFFSSDFNFAFFICNFQIFPPSFCAFSRNFQLFLPNYKVLSVCTKNNNFSTFSAKLRFF